eukprot:1825060-Rhodomonas_salina.2
MVKQHGEHRPYLAIRSTKSAAEVFILHSVNTDIAFTCEILGLFSFASCSATVFAIIFAMVLTL